MKEWQNESLKKDNGTKSKLEDRFSYIDKIKGQSRLLEKVIKISNQINVTNTNYYTI